MFCYRRINLTLHTKLLYFLHMSEVERQEFEALKSRVEKLEREKAEFYTFLKRAFMTIVHFIDRKFELKIETL